MSVHLSKAERDVMEHAVGWHSENKFYRNYFAAGPGHADWETLLGLCERKLMQMRHVEERFLGGLTVFIVTGEGVDALKQPSVGTPRICPGCRSLDGEHTFKEDCTLEDKP